MKRKTTLLAFAALGLLALAALPSMALGFETTPAVRPVAPASVPLAYTSSGVPSHCSRRLADEYPVNRRPGKVWSPLLIQDQVEQSPMEAERARSIANARLLANRLATSQLKHCQLTRSTSSLKVRLIHMKHRAE